MEYNILGMLQIDDKKVQIYNCEFRLRLGVANIPLKVSGHYFVEWRIKNGKLGVKTPLINSSKSDEVAMNESLDLRVEMFADVGSKEFYRRESMLTLYLISSRKPQSVKIVGRMVIGLHDVVNNGKYGSMGRHRLTYSSLQVEMELMVECVERSVQTLLQANLEEALLSEQILLVGSGKGVEGQYLLNRNRMLKGKKSFVSEEDQVCSRGDYSFLVMDGEENDRSLCGQGQGQGGLEREQVAINSAVFEMGSKCQRIIQDDQTVSQRVNAIQQHDLQFLVKENNNLKKLLWIARNQKKLQVYRLQEEIKELARELAQRENEMMKMRENQETGVVRVGELLDEARMATERWEGNVRECEALREHIGLERELNVQLRENYSRLESRLQVVKGWELEKVGLLERMKVLQEENEFIKVRHNDIEYRLDECEEVHRKQLGELKEKVDNLQFELEESNAIIQVYEDKIRQKISQFEEEISVLQDDEVIVHNSVTYSNIKQTKEQTKNQRVVKVVAQKKMAKKAASLMHIQDEDSKLHKITEEELQQSLQSISRDKDMKTSDESPHEVNSEDDFYRKMARDVQAQLDQLRLLYREKEGVIVRERATSKNLWQQLQRLRFEFVYELSRVSAQLNEKMFEIHALKEEICGMKNGKQSNLEGKIHELTEKIYSLQEEKLDYFDRCYRYQQENIALIHVNQEKEQVLQSIIQPLCVQSICESDIVKNFQRLVNIMMNNPTYYVATLRKYGLNNPGQLLTDSTHRNVVNVDAKPVNMSELINNFNGDGTNNNWSDTSRSSNFTKGEQQDLPLNSIAKITMETEETQNSFGKLVEFLNKLSLDRQMGLSYIRQVSNRSKTINRYSNRQHQIVVNLKKLVIRQKSSERQQMLRLLVDLQALMQHSTIIQ